MQLRTIGIDVGGTNIKTGLVNGKGRLLYKTSSATASFVSDKEALIDHCVHTVEDILSRHRVHRKILKGIGIGLPGLVNHRTGVVQTLTNIPHWRRVPLKQILERRLKIPVVIDNDVNMMALGEWRLGAGRQQDNIICITLGTGVGGALIFDGQLYRGSDFTAGEIGHFPIRANGKACNCGGTGCLERYVGNKVLQRKAARLFRQPDITLEEVTRLASKGHRKAVAFWDETAVILGQVLSGVVNLLNPQRIVIGGGVANANRFLFKPLKTFVRQRAMAGPTRHVQIVKAKLGTDAGVLGAAILARQIRR